MNRFFMAFDVALVLTWCAVVAFMYDVVCRHDGSVLFYLPFTPFVVILSMLSAAAVSEYSGSKSESAVEIANC